MLNTVLSPRLLNIMEDAQEQKLCYMICYCTIHKY